MKRIYGAGASIGAKPWSTKKSSSSNKLIKEASTVGSLVAEPGAGIKTILLCSNEPKQLNM